VLGEPAGHPVSGSRSDRDSTVRLSEIERALLFLDRPSAAFTRRRQSIESTRRSRPSFYELFSGASPATSPGSPYRLDSRSSRWLLQSFSPPVDSSLLPPNGDLPLVNYRRYSLPRLSLC